MNSGGHVIIRNTVVRGNIADRDIGGVGNRRTTASKILLDNCIVEGNQAAQRGGGIGVEEGQLILQHTMVTRNVAAMHGGGMLLQNGWSFDCHIGRAQGGAQQRAHAHVIALMLSCSAMAFVTRRDSALLDPSP